MLKSNRGFSRMTLKSGVVFRVVERVLPSYLVAKKNVEDFLFVIITIFDYHMSVKDTEGVSTQLPCVKQCSNFNESGVPNRKHKSQTHVSLPSALSAMLLQIFSAMTCVKIILIYVLYKSLVLQWFLKTNLQSLFLFYQAGTRERNKGTHYSISIIFLPRLR